MADPDAVEAAVARAAEGFGQLDVAFDNAGVESQATPVHEIELAECDRILGISLRGT